MPDGVRRLLLAVALHEDPLVDELTALSESSVVEDPGAFPVAADLIEGRRDSDCPRSDPVPPEVGVGAIATVGALPRRRIALRSFSWPLATTIATLRRLRGPPRATAPSAWSSIAAVPRSASATSQQVRGRAGVARFRGGWVRAARLGWLGGRARVRRRAEFLLAGNGRAAS
jgi:hypothetical protein